MYILSQSFYHCCELFVLSGAGIGPMIGKGLSFFTK